MKVTVKPSDKTFSRVVRESNDWTCERCGSKHERGSQGMHNSHIFSRRYRTIRWSKDNTQSLCYPCHSWFGGNPADSGYWITELLGEEHMAMLREKRDSRVKVSKLEEKEIAKHYRSELKRIESLRDEGVTGVIDFVSWQ